MSKHQQAQDAYTAAATNGEPVKQDLIDLWEDVGEPSEIAEEDIPHFMLASGQSGMLVGMNSNVRAGARVIRNPNVWVWSTPANAWLQTAPGMPDWPHLPNGNNLAYAAACRRQERRGGKVLLLIVAAGGQPVEQWLPALASSDTGFQNMFGILNGYLELARDAVLPFRSDSKTLRDLEKTEADELLWHQGEANADYRGNSTGATYKLRLLQVFDLMRDPAAFGSSAAPMIRAEAPIAIGQLLKGGTGSGGDPTDDRNVEINEIGAEQPLISVVSSDGLKSGDNLHFWGEDQITFGARYAEVLENTPKLVSERISDGATICFKHPDGRLECEALNVGSADTDTASGALYTSADVVWTFPTPFIAPPSVSFSAPGASTRWGSLSAVSTTGATGRIFSTVQSNTSVTVQASASGRWR